MFFYNNNNNSNHSWPIHAGGVDLNILMECLKAYPKGVYTENVPGKKWDRFRFAGDFGGRFFVSDKYKVFFFFLISGSLFSFDFNLF